MVYLLETFIDFLEVLSVIKVIIRNIDLKSDEILLFHGFHA